MTLFKRSLFLAATLLPLSSLVANDEIFPPAPAAADAIHFDSNGFFIHGQRVFLASGSIHYARVPRELWRERLLQLKRAGFNTVQTYVFWNFHETQQGKYDFTTGAHDLAAFLQTAQEVGLYATVRVGPYDCAEWDSGGYPVWLRFLPGLKVRAANQPFLDALDKFWDRLLPIVMAHQISRGGNVIFVQLENEDRQGWGTDMPNGYFTHLRDKALAMGLEVPYFFSGLHHGTSPAFSGGHTTKNPWYSTETWVRWYDQYGNADPASLAKYERNIWDMISSRANGFNLYMFHSGTNFDYWNDSDSASSYDYGTLVGQAGDLRNLYYGIRRAALFATSFPEILENSTPSSGDAVLASAPEHAPPPDGAKSNPPVQVSERASPAGTAVFVRNMRPVVQTATLSSGGFLQLDPWETVPLLRDTLLAPGIRASLADVRSLALATQGKTATWIVYGKPGETARLELDLDHPGNFTPPVGSSAFKIEATDTAHPKIDLFFSDAAPAVLLCQSGDETLRILAETFSWTDRTWIVGEKSDQTVITGPLYVGDFQVNKGRPRLTIGRPFGTPAPGELIVYGPAPQPIVQAVSDPAPQDEERAPLVGSWQIARADGSAAPEFADANWKTSDQPLQLGADGDVSNYGWYRAAFNAPADGQAQLSGTFADRATIFLNGAVAGRVNGKGSLTVPVCAGPNVLAAFALFQGREKAFGYVDKPLGTFCPKGILALTLTLNNEVLPVTNWKLHGGVDQPTDASGAWQQVPAHDLGAPAFFRTTFTGKAMTPLGPRPIYRISTTGLTRGSIWLNGHNLGRYPEGLKIDGLYLPECWIRDGTNNLVLFDAEGHVPTAAVKIWCEHAASRELFQVGG